MPESKKDCLPIELFYVREWRESEKGDGLWCHSLILSELQSNNCVQSTLVISTSVISNNRLSRRENLVLVLT